MSEAANDRPPRVRPSTHRVRSTSAETPVSIRLEDVGLRFVRGRAASSVKSVVLKALRGVFGRRESNTVPAAEAIWPLDGVSLDLARGDRLGVVGRNGAGKTTLLRVLAGIYPPTRGRVEIAGSVAPVLQLGLGFNAELTGRENVYLAAAIAGMPRATMKTKLDEIFGFAELEDYLDVPLKYYSSGMYARLAFAVATELETDILLLDEVFAVGDIHWIERALERVERLIERVGILVLVSHDLALVERVCNRAIWLDAGGIRHEGEVSDVVSRYRESV
jgi:ABC-type polysaccharide/polyol phosphate transport system ATPase subunit